MASQADLLKSEPVKPAPDVVNHPYKNRFKGSTIPQDPDAVNKNDKKYPGLPYEKLLMVMELLK